MARRWTIEEENKYREELWQLYSDQNMSIREAGVVLGIAEATVYDRLVRLGIPIMREAKARYNNRRSRDAIMIPEHRSAKLAEFFGIMLGDGHISHFQTIVTLGTKELEYVEYIANLMKELFGVQGRICRRANGYRDVYIGSVELTAWLKREGLVQNKVASQVDAPPWLFERCEYMQSFLRGFFDTDGSVYRLRFGRQIELTNLSVPLLYALHRMLTKLGYTPSKVSSCCVYLTRKGDVDRFFKEIQPANTKHLRRFVEMNLTRR